MLSVSKSTAERKAFLFVRKQIEGDDPYNHINNLYASIEDKIARGIDVPGCRLMRALLDEFVNEAETINWLRGTR